jgi:hypothetical protein
VVVRNQDVYAKLKKHNIPEEMIVYASLDKKEPDDLGLEEGLAPSTA